MDESFVKLSVRRGVSLSAGDGRDITPKAQKERALLALLATSDNHLRSRVWICEKLWSGSSQVQGLASLRRALCNIRKIAGDDADFIVGTQREVLFSTNVEVERDSDNSSLMEDIVVHDPQFQNWLNSLRGDGPAAIPSQWVPPHDSNDKRPDKEPLIDVRLVEVFEPTTSEEAFVQSLLIDGLATRFSVLGDGLKITRHTPNDVPKECAQGTIDVSVESLIADKGWRVNVRAINANSRSFIWSGTLSIPLDFELICNGTKVGAFVTQAISGIIGRYMRAPDRVPGKFFQLQSASSRLFSGQHADIVRAQQELHQLPTSGVTLAWRAFGKLTETIESASQNADTINESLHLAQEAVFSGSENPVVLALAAQIQLKLSDDPDYGIYLADQAIQLCEHDPYALLARSQACLFQSDADASRTAAHWARESASTMTHSYWWDMQCALSEVGSGNLALAKTLAKQAHLKLPIYRPALRYLVALSMLENDMAATELFANRLRGVEAGFQISDLFKPAYPVQTLRMTGLLKMMQPDHASSHVG